MALIYTVLSGMRTVFIRISAARSAIPFDQKHVIGIFYARLNGDLLHIIRGNP